MKLSQARHTARRSLELLRANPRLFADRALHRVTQRTRIVAASGSSTVSQTLDEVIASLVARSVAKVLVYADKSAFETVADALPHASTAWLSHDAGDVVAGAMLPVRASFEAVDAVVVAGPDAKLGYLAVLRQCAESGALPLVLWADTGWEMCGSQLPVPAAAEEVDIFLFNHFQDYFLVKEPLLVMITAADATRSAEAWRLVGPRETLHLTLSDLLPARNGPVIVDVRTTHPSLTRGRHQRWRVCADVHWKGSFTTLHGGHDYGPPHHIESRRPLHDLRNGGVAVVLPNNGKTGDAKVTIAIGDDRRTTARHTDHVVDEIAFEPVSDQTAGRIYGYAYTAAGTPFWFHFVERAGVASLSGNHELSVRIKDDPVGLRSSARASYEELTAAGFMLHPHALPLLPDAEIELGFSFLAANPVLRRFNAVAYNSIGSEVGRFTLVHTGDEPLFGDDVRTQIGGDADLVVFGPDWATMAADPTLLGVGGDLVVRHRRTGDYDVTEFQNCWRNLGAKVAKFPHWIHPANAVTGRTNVLARLRMDDRFRTGLILAHASGRIDYERQAKVRVEAIEQNGRSHLFERPVSSFSAAVWWADDMFPELAGRELVGALLVTSPDADLNCQLVTTTDDGRVSLQHLWGY